MSMEKSHIPLKEYSHLQRTMVIYGEHCPGLSEATFYAGSESTSATGGQKLWPLTIDVSNEIFSGSTDTAATKVPSPKFWCSYINLDNASTWSPDIVDWYCIEKS